MLERRWSDASARRAVYLAAMATEGWANGRVNLIGEHTDYNGGLVLPTLIPRRTWMEIRTRTDQIISLRSDAPGCAPVETSLGAVAPRHDWSDYVLGVVDVLERRGHELRGFDASVRSE